MSDSGYDNCSRGETVSGWIKLWRSVFDSALWDCSDSTLRVAIWMLLRAGHTESKFMFNGREITLKPGQFISGRFAGAKECRMKPSTFYDAIRRLNTIKFSDTKSDNKKTIFTVIKWAQYQVPEKSPTALPTTTRHNQEERAAVPKAAPVVKQKMTQTEMYLMGNPNA